MSHSSEHHSLHTYHSEEQGFTPPPSSSQQQNAATIAGESQRLAKENKELWTCLKLMRENSELETASLISSVIAWCDDKFKRRFLELNSALSRQNLPAQSSFRPISPAQSPALDIYKRFTPSSKGASEIGSSASRSSIGSGSLSPQSKVIKSALTASSRGSDVSSGIQRSYQSQNYQEFSRETSPRGSTIQGYRFISPPSSARVPLSFNRQNAPSPTQGSVYDVVETEVYISDFYTFKRTDAPSPTQGSVYDVCVNEPPSPTQKKSLKDKKVERGQSPQKVERGQSPQKSPRSITPVSFKELNIPAHTSTKKDETRKSPPPRTTSPGPSILKDKPKSLEKRSSKGFLPADEKQGSVHQQRAPPVSQRITESPPPERITSTQPTPPKRITSTQPPPPQRITSTQPPPPQRITSTHPPPPQRITSIQSSPQRITGTQPPPPQRITSTQPPPPQQITGTQSPPSQRITSTQPPLPQRFTSTQQRMKSTQPPSPKRMSPIIKETFEINSTPSPKTLTSRYQDSGFGASTAQSSVISDDSQPKPEQKRTITSSINLDSKEARDQYIQSLIENRQKSIPPVSEAIDRNSIVSTSTKASYADSYSRYPSTLNSDALQSDPQSKSMFPESVQKPPIRDLKDVFAESLKVSSPLKDMKASSTPPTMSYSSKTPGRPLTLADLSITSTGDLSFASSKELALTQAKDLASLSSTHGSSTFVPKLDGTERVPTPFPLDLKTVQTADDSSISSFGEPLIHSTPKKDTKKKVRISPIPEHFENEEPFVRAPSNKNFSFTDDSSMSSFGAPHAHSTPLKEPKKAVLKSTNGEEVFKKLNFSVEKDFVASGSISTSSSVKNQSFRPSHRLLGEIAFQLERRILDYIFAKRIKGEKERLHRRFYGYTVSNIPSMIVRESTAKSGQVDLEKKVSFQYRFEYIIKSLLTFGYVMEKHSQFSLKMINKYGLLTHPPDRKTVEAFGLHDPSSLRLFVIKLSTSEKERSNMMILLECLLFLAHDDGQAVFLW